MVSTHLKNISQIGNLPQKGVKIKNIWNHHLVFFLHHTKQQILSPSNSAIVTFLGWWVHVTLSEVKWTSKRSGIKGHGGWITWHVISHSFLPMDALLPEYLSIDQGHPRGKKSQRQNGRFISVFFSQIRPEREEVKLRPVRGKKDMLKHWIWNHPKFLGLQSEI